MLNQGPDNLVFYCPQHQLRFRATRDAVVTCEQGGHSVGYGFPEKSWWEYCCDCATFWPSQPSSGYLRRSECLVCERPTAKRYVCDACQVVSIESAALVRRKLHSITSEGGISPSCPGCAKRADGVPSEHQCGEIAAYILTSRATCPFCENAISTDGAPKSKVLSSQNVPILEEGEKKTSDVEDTTLEPEIELTSTDIPPWQSTLPAVPPKRRVRLIPAVIAVAITVVVVLTLAIILRASRNGSKSGVPNLPPTGPVGMVYVPGGQFTIGNDLGDEYEKPAHEVTVKPFFIDKNEVTCGEYEKFIKATNHRSPPNWGNATCPAAAPNNPVTGVDWYDATTYAQWAGKRLPTEEEWELAARGTDKRVYPWGSDWRRNGANAGDGNQGRVVDVGSYPDGKSPFGAFDMIGNAWEWTSTDLKAYPNGHISDQTPGELKVIRGGYWGSSAPKATTTFRRGWDARDAPLGYKNTGFRCAKDS
jgi:formylglycine-generating enzyme required for sulfatase activity